MLIRSNIFNHSNVLAADYQNLLGSIYNINNAINSSEVIFKTVMAISYLYVSLTYFETDAT